MMCLNISQFRHLVMEPVISTIDKSTIDTISEGHEYQTITSRNKPCKM